MFGWIDRSFQTESWAKPMLPDGRHRKRRLATFKKPFALVARHHLVEQPLFGACVVEVVVNDLVPECRARHRSGLEGLDRFAQRRWETSGIRFVRIPFERRRQLEVVLDPVKTGGDQRGKCEIWSDVAPWDPRLDPLRGPVTDDAKAARPIVVSPCECRRSPRPGGVALVRV